MTNSLTCAVDLSDLAHKQHRARFEEEGCEGVSAQCAILQPCQGEDSTALAGKGSDGEDSTTLADAGSDGGEAGSGAEEAMGCAAEGGEEPQSYHTPSDALEGLDVGHASIPGTLTALRPAPPQHRASHPHSTIPCTLTSPSLAPSLHRASHPHFTVPRTLTPLTCADLAQS